MNIRSVRVFLILPIAIPVALAACNNETPSTNSGSSSKPATKKDSAKVAAAEKPAQQFTYHLIRTKDSSGKEELAALSKEQAGILYAINRVDAGAAKRQDTLVVPDRWDGDLMAYAPYPAEVPLLVDIPKIIFFSYPAQAYGVYEAGKLIRWGPTSMGKKSTQTPTGLFFSNWKAKETISTVNDEWKLKYYFNVHNKEGVSWHQYQMPGYPASHACMRLLMHDAVWLYDWAEQWKLSEDRSTVVLNGTPVIIFGAYDWSHPKPWRGMASDPTATIIGVDSLTRTFEAYLPKIKEERAKRDAAASAADTSVAGQG